MKIDVAFEAPIFTRVVYRAHLILIDREWWCSCFPWFLRARAFTFRRCIVIAFTLVILIDIISIGIRVVVVLIVLTWGVWPDFRLAFLGSGSKVLIMYNVSYDMLSKSAVS